MTTQKLERRAVLRGAGIAGTGALLALTAPEALAHDDIDADSIVGAWMVEVTPQGGPPPHRVLMLHTVGGGVVGSTSNPPSGGSPVYGVWARSGRRQFHVTFLGFTFNDTGNSTGTVKVRTRSTLSADGRALDGTAIVTLHDPSGQQFAMFGSSFRGTRISLEPLP
jgi:hypothetical protein